MKTFSIYLLAALVGVGAVSCSDDKDDATPSKTSLLTAKSWRMTDIKASGFSVYAAFVPACNQDDVVRFNADNTLTYTANAKCDPSDSDTETGAWALSNNDTQLSITDPDGEVVQGTFTVSSSTLVVSGSEDLLGTGTPIPVEVTFTAQ